MVFCRGTQDDYDRWANVTGDDNWSWKKLLPFIFKVDRMTAPADQHSTTGQFNPTVHKDGKYTYVFMPVGWEPLTSKARRCAHQRRGPSP